MSTSSSSPSTPAAAVAPSAVSSRPADGTPLRRWGLGAAALLVVGGGVAVWSSGRGPSHGAEGPGAAAVHVTPWLEGGRIHLPPGFAEREGLRFVEAKRSVLTPTVQVTGVVTTDARRVAALGARIDGRLRAVHKVAGDDVAAGEVVAELESVALGQAQAEVLKLRAREEVARLDAERERRLADAKISPERDAQHAAANAAALTAERMAAERGVEAMGGSVSGEAGVLRLRSPLGGRVVEAHARRGQVVEPRDTLFVVADLSRVWVELSVYERDLGAVREGDQVEVRLPSDRSRVFTGTIAHIAEIIDAQDRAAEVRVELPNTGALRPGLSVTATIHASGPRDEHLVVPRTAITRVDGRPTVFVQRGAGEVEPRAVELGPEDADEVGVLGGLAPQERVAASGVLALKAEVFR